MGNWLEIGDATRTPLKLNVQLNSTDLCQNESVLSWTPHPYPFGTFSCINRWKKMDIMCLTELRFGTYILPRYFFSFWSNFIIYVYVINKNFLQIQLMANGVNGETMTLAVSLGYHCIKLSNCHFWFLISRFVIIALYYIFKELTLVCFGQNNSF